MPVIERLTLIIDGNNLAHYLHYLPTGQVMSADEIFRLAVHLTHYAHQAQPAITIELCIDPLPPDVEVPLLPWVRCLVAPAYSSADDLLRERFRFHQHRGAGCVVITNDGEVREDIEEEGGECLLGYDFVRRSGHSPVFRQPGEFKAVSARRAPPPAKRPSELDWDRLLMAVMPAVERDTPQPEEGSIPQPCAYIPDDAADLGISAQSAVTAPLPIIEPAQPIYRLVFEAWPPETGLRFLLSSFCRAHQQDEDWQLYQSLAADEIRPSDLRDLANLLRQRCGSEPGFAQQGALMKRVRLALIGAEDFRLSLAGLIQKTGLNALGLKGRIGEKAAPWVEIIPPRP